jgi:AH receptor-interacting protein
VEWLNLNAMKLPLLLNYAQCKLLNKEYYAVIEHCTTVLKSDPGMYKLSEYNIYLYLFKLF